MVQVNLKKLISKKEVSSIINSILSEDSIIVVEDLKGGLILERNHINLSSTVNKYALRNNLDVIIGWVKGDDQASLIYSLLSHLINKEIESRTLANEALDRYREINFLYTISSRMASCLGIKEVAALVIDEVKKLIKSNSASLMLLNAETGTLEVISALGKEYNHKTTMRAGEGIAGHVLLSGKAEIVNDVLSDPRYTPGEKVVRSLICAPIATKDQIIGVFNISNDELVQYTAQELKLFMALASQASAAIENALLHENKLKEERIKNNLERYLSPQVVEAVISAKGEVSLNTTKRKITMLFSDIRNFTSKCEELAPEAIVMYLNEYFTHMVEEIFTHKGTVNKFVGDMIVAMFGAPSMLVDQEKCAIEAAIAMQERIATIPMPWVRDNFATGIGITSGDVVVGNIGSPQHMDYTAIGDEVNIASRLQSIAQGGQILVSRSVYDVTEHIFKFKQFGTVPVKGRKKAVEIFEVLY